MRRRGTGLPNTVKRWPRSVEQQALRRGVVSVDPARKKRLQALQEVFQIQEEYGETPTWTILSESLADHLNRKYARQVVVPKERKR